MTQEDKQLLITDLCARLPYGVKSQNRWIDVNKNEHLYIDKIKWIDENYIRTDGEGKYYFLERIKPILFPLSAINQEIEVSKEKICVNDFILNNTGFQVSETYLCCPMSIYRSLEIDEMDLILDTFHRCHIDYRDLIDKGLAISVFDLQENPYK